MNLFQLRSFGFSKWNRVSGCFTWKGTLWVVNPQWNPRKTQKRKPTNNSNIWMESHLKRVERIKKALPSKTHRFRYFHIPSISLMRFQSIERSKHAKKARLIERIWKRNNSCATLKFKRVVAQIMVRFNSSDRPEKVHPEVRQSTISFIDWPRKKGWKPRKVWH